MILSGNSKDDKWLGTTNKKFVLSLSGNWGSGKTTIFERSGVYYSVIRKRRWKRDLLSLIFNISETTRGVKFSFLNSEDQKTISDIRNSINAYLALSKISSGVCFGQH